MHTTRQVIEAHWQTSNTRDWDAFAALLHPDLHYDVPQTRERLRGGAAYVDLFRTWPGHWRADIRTLIAEGDAGVSVIDFVIGDDHQTGISFFEVKDGLITRVTDHWPEPYEPPVRACAFIERY